jgi:hypothetical protein
MDGVFVGSGIFKSSDPIKRARAIVQAVTHYKDAKVPTLIRIRMNIPITWFVPNSRKCTARKNGCSSCRPLTRVLQALAFCGFFMSWMTDRPFHFLLVLSTRCWLR